MIPGIYNLGDFSIGAAGVLIGTPIVNLEGLSSVTLDARFQFGSGGITVIAVVQTSLNQGATWIDIARFDFATSGLEKVITLTRSSITSPYSVTTLVAEGSQNGILGDRFRTVITSTGTYAGSTVLSIRAAAW